MVPCVVKYSDVALRVALNKSWHRLILVKYSDVVPLGVMLFFPGMLCNCLLVHLSLSGGCLMFLEVGFKTSLGFPYVR